MDIDLHDFQILSIEIGGLSVLLRWLFLGGISSPVGDSIGSRVASTFASLSSNVLKVSNLAFVSANIATIC